MLLALLVLAAPPKADPRLVGTWQLNGQPFMTLEENGKGQMEDGPFRWRVQGSSLVVTDDEGEADTLPFQLEGDALTLSTGGVRLQLKRGGKAAAKGGKFSKAAEKAAAGASDDAEAMAQAQAWLAQQQGGAQPRGGQGQPGRGAQPGPQRAGNDQLSRLLLSSAWCWLRYANGNSYTQKVRFSPDGTWSDSSESDLYVSNTLGTAQATGNRQGGGQWQVRGGQLWLSSPDSPQLQPIPLTVTQNSNGYPIINADGKEYSQCD